MAPCGGIDGSGVGIELGEWAGESRPGLGATMDSTNGGNGFWLINVRTSVRVCWFLYHDMAADWQSYMQRIGAEPIMMRAAAGKVDTHKPMPGRVDPR